MKITKQDKLFISKLFSVLERMYDQRDNPEKAIKEKAYKQIDRTVHELIRFIESFFKELYSSAEYEKEETKDFLKLSEAKANERLNDYLGVCMCLKERIALGDSLIDLDELKEFSTCDLKAKRWPKGFYSESKGVQRFVYVCGNPFEVAE